MQASGRFDRTDAGIRGREAHGTGDDAARDRADRAQAVAGDIDALARYWAARGRELLPEAGDEFISFVKPAFLYGVDPAIGHDDFNALFTEWLLFDYTRGGRTPAQKYAARPPAGTGPERAARIRQVVGTQLFSRFIIRDKDAPSGLAVLEDVRTSRRRDVYDPALCARERWRDGTIGERIACVDGLWLSIGTVRLYDRAPPRATSSAAPVGTRREDRRHAPEADGASCYLRLVRDVIGIDGRYRRTAAVSPLDVPQETAAEAPG